MASLKEVLTAAEQEVQSSFSGHRSAWTFETSGTGGVGFGFFAMSGGEIKLYDPKKGEHAFWFGGAGGGLSVGVGKIIGMLAKLGKFTRLAQIVGKLDPKDIGSRRAVSAAPEWLSNHGVVFALAGCGGPDLTEADFPGACIYLDLGASLIYGYSGEILLMNCNPQAVAALEAGGLAGELMFMTLLRPHAMLLSCGPSRGLQANVGVSVCIGYLSTRPA